MHDRTVLIAIDHSTRELFGAALMAHYFEAAGVRAVLCNTVSFTEYYARYQPDAVVWPNAEWDLTWVARQCAVFVMPSESGNGQPEWIARMAGTANNPVHPRPVTRFFCWGTAMRDILEKSGVWSGEQLLVTGNPSTDHWLLPQAAAGATGRVGMTTTFRALSNSIPPSKWNPFEWLDEVERTGGEGQYYLPPGHAEGWMFVEASVARVMITLARMLAVDGPNQVEIRPHPFERVERYRYFERLPGGRVSVRKRGTMSEWLDRVCVLFTFMSASSLDAIIRGVPVVSIHPVLDADAARKIPRLLRYEYEDWLWPLTRIEEAIEYVEHARAGRLAPCRDEPALARFLRDHFAYPRRRPAAATIVDHILDTLRGRPRPAGIARRRPVNGLRRAPFWAAAHVPYAAACLASARYVQGLLPGHHDLGFMYWPWRWRQKQQAASAVATLVAGLEADEGRAMAASGERADHPSRT